MAETGHEIDATLMRLENQNFVSQTLEKAARTDQTHLSRHFITEISRARMIDWLYEVLTAFNMSEQTFFLSVQYLDRYITAAN